MKKAIMSIVTVWILVSNVFVGMIGFVNIEYVKAPYTPHNPIRVNSDAEFTSMAGIEGWIGDGSPGNPYLIEGYDINGSGYGYCIYIGNTTVNFEVRDSYLHEADGVTDKPYYFDSAIILHNVSNSKISNINATMNNRCGIYVSFSSNNTVINNTATNNFVGIHIDNSNGNSVNNNKVSSNSNSIYIIFSSNNTIANNNASNNEYSIYLYSSSSNTIANNIVSSNDWYGIYLTSSCNNNTITNNNASSNNHTGIYLYDSSNSNIIANNTVSFNNRIGIRIFRSNSNIITNNTMEENSIYLGGEQLLNWNSQTIDISNTVNSKPVYYWKNQVGGTVPFGAGEVILANCSFVVVENQDVNNGSIGIQLGFSKNNTIANNNASSNSEKGIYLDFSSGNNIVVNNNAWNNRNGISIISSNNNLINNTVYSNSQTGIFISSLATSNIITNNYVLNNDYGIYTSYPSSINKIYHNNILNNTYQAYDELNNGNQWDNGYPSGGNYWSDYSGVDNFKGPNQDIPGSDGIGDTPYIIDSDSQDNYPLMSPTENYTYLYEGWNFISLSVIQNDTKLSNVLSSITGLYDAVQWYNINDTSDHWKHNHTLKSPDFNDLENIDHTMGFWIHIINPGGALFHPSGTQPTQNQTIPLYPGWNMVGYPSLTNRNRTAGLNNLTFGLEVDAIWTFNAAIQKWEEINGGDSFEMGRGYWIHATQECEWEVPV